MPRRSRNELYPFGFVGLLFANTIFSQWIVYFHEPPGSNPAGGRFVGPALLASFVLMAALNPWLGDRADRLRHPWGRRRPFVLLGSVPLALAFAVLWFVESPALAVPAILVYGVLFVLVLQPYASLLPSLAAERRTRLRWSVTGAAAGLAASGAALVGAPRILERWSWPGLAAAGAGAILATVLLPALFLRESESPVLGPTTSLGSRLREALSERSVRAFLAANGLAVLALTSLTIAVPYVAEGALGRPREYTGVLNQWFLGGLLAGIPLLALGGRRHSPLRLFRAAALLAALVLAALLAVSAGPGAPVLAWKLGLALLGLPALAILSLPPVVLSEFADAGVPGREGTLFGLNGTALNLGNAAGALATTWCLAHGIGSVLALSALAMAVASGLAGRGVVQTANPVSANEPLRHGRTPVSGTRPDPRVGSD